MHKGRIELHGALLVINLEEVQESIPVPPEYKTKFLPGDEVVCNDDFTSITLYRRSPQKTIGVVQKVLSNSHVVLKFPLFGPACPFTYIHDATAPLFSRFVVSLKEDGMIEVQKNYTSNAIDDVPLLLDVYRSFSAPPLVYAQPTNPFYTKQGIVDHTDLDTFTIDPATSVDFDDALSVNVETKTVYIHIVDIVEAIQTELPKLHSHVSSLYLANEHTEHLLADRATVDQYSLNEGEVRPVITVACTLSEEGDVVSYDIYKSTIVVKKRWCYEQVADSLALGTAPPSIQWLANLSTQRNKDVQYSIQLPSLALTIDKDTGALASVQHAVTNDAAHTLVATAMILGNIVVSKHLASSNVVLPNRFHEKLRGFRPFSTQTENPHVDSFILVKRYARAYYALDKKGHFGLGLTEYVHFTSPMRRYADVLVHMLLAGYTFSGLDEIVAHINHRSFLCRALQSYYEDCKIGRFMLSENPGPYDVWITDVKAAGVMWFCPSLNRNGFAHVSTLKPETRWIYSQETLQNQDGSILWKTGTRVKGMVSGLDRVTMYISMTLLHE